MKRVDPLDATGGLGTLLAAGGIAAWWGWPAGAVFVGAVLMLLAILSAGRRSRY